VRLIKAIALASAALCACAAILLQASSGAAATRRTPLAYDPATQSHPGACSQNTLDVSQAVGDLNANGVLGKYASLVGVQATGSALTAEMKQTLMVLKVLNTTVTANHGCTTDGIIFPSGSRTLTAGETVGVAVPARIRAKLCRGSTAGCEREVLTEQTVFPTNCWNLDQGTVKVAVYVHRPKTKVKVVEPKPKPKPKPRPKPRPKPKPLVAQPSADVAATCGVSGPGFVTVTLANGGSATKAATFEVNGKSYGPVAAGQSMPITVGLESSGNLELRVSSGGEALVDQSLPADACPVTPALEAAPTATAALTCSAGWVSVTLKNGATATTGATFEVGGTSYGPLAAGESETVTVPITPGVASTVTVTSGGATLLTSAVSADACASDASAVLPSLACAPPVFDGEGDITPGGGVVVVELTNGSTATLPASFVVTATGSTTAGYGPTTVGPVAVGSTQTVLIPVDASGNDISVTVSSGGVQLQSVLLPGGCPGTGESL